MGFAGISLSIDIVLAQEPERLTSIKEEIATDWEIHPVLLAQKVFAMSRNDKIFLSLRDGFCRSTSPVGFAGISLCIDIIQAQGCERLSSIKEEIATGLEERQTLAMTMR